MFKLQRWTGIITVAFSAFTVAGNALYYHDIVSLWSIVLGSISVFIFAISIFWNNIVMRISQVVMIAIVAVFAITSEPDKTLDVVCGCFFILVSVALSVSYNFFDKSPYLVASAVLMCLIGSFWVASGSGPTGAAIAFAIFAGTGVLWAIVYVKIKSFEEALRKVVKAGDRMDDALAERKKDGPAQ